MCILCSIICAHYLLPNNLCKRFFLEIKLRFGLGVCIFFFLCVLLYVGDHYYCLHTEQYCSHTVTLLFTHLKILKMSFTVQFTYLKLILLQYFQFSVFNFSKNKLYTNRTKGKKTKCWVP